MANTPHMAQFGGPITEPDHRADLARHLREPHRSRILCPHRIVRDKYCRECGERVKK